VAELVPTLTTEASESAAAPAAPSPPHPAPEGGRGRRRWARALARIVLFPWGIWWATALAPRRLRRRIRDAAWAGALAWSLHGVLYAGIGAPLTVVVTGELLIVANEWAIGEQADYGLRSDFAAGLADSPIELPGPPAPPAPSVPPTRDAADPRYRQYLVERFSPVIVQKVAHHPEWDIPVALDFDGNGDPRDNVRNEPHHRPHAAVVYGELTAETEDSYYLTYSLYRVKDYDHPLRQLLTDWTFHDNDNEGLMLRVDKRSMRIAQVETWFHNRFLLYATTPQSAGSEPIAGAIHTEGGSHPIVYGQSQGHGVRLFQAVDTGALERNVKILRWQGSRSAVPVRADRSVQHDATYTLRSFDAWYAQALSFTPSGTPGKGLFEDFIPLGRMPDGTELRIGRYIAGLDYSKVGWSRPKPPWSWDDGWDRVPIWAWHFLPSMAFASHSGADISHRYVYNHPMRLTFGMRPEEIFPHLHVEMATREGDKWETLENRGGNLDHRTYWHTLELLAKGYVNYLFRSLG